RSEERSDVAELGHHPGVDAALERDDQLGQPFQSLPAPLRELRLVPAAARTYDVDLGVCAFEAQREPFLFLSAIASTPRLRDPLHGQVVREPARRLPDQAHRPYRGLLVELAERSPVGVLGVAESALRHLPPAALAFPLGILVRTAPDPHQAGAVEKRNSDAGAIGQLLALHPRQRRSASRPRHPSALTVAETAERFTPARNFRAAGSPHRSTPEADRRDATRRSANPLVWIEPLRGRAHGDEAHATQDPSRARPRRGA